MRNNNKLKLVEINTYYGKSYNAHVDVMKTIVFTCLPILILAIFINEYNGKGEL